ncbi:uncharacterized protein EAF01_008936 [Botrytis porri]|uniref:uncharacterized protein n=1 Tax=Botrytis porri TaxID=87229 RepID=UPI0018FF4EF1|nr:uncharacterized protein EAF01_008936 [Botrytis porri]KAF7897970.1 hypothetical protein EAF01_008936 [Botrytis porri]
MIESLGSRVIDRKPSSHDEVQKIVILQRFPNLVILNSKVQHWKQLLPSNFAFTKPRSNFTTSKSFLASRQNKSSETQDFTMSSNSEQPSLKTAMTTSSQTTITRQPTPPQQMDTQSNTEDSTSPCVEACVGTGYVVLCSPFQGCGSLGGASSCGQSCGNCDCNGDC